MFDKLFDLPAHPLLTHAPMVLLPLAAIITLVAAVRPAWRARSGWWILGGLIITLVLLFAAKESGEALIDAYDRANGEGAVDVDLHQSLAETTFIITIIWTAVFGALTLLEGVGRLRTGAFESLAASTAVRQGLAFVAAALGILATIWLIRTGHEGARSVWGPRVDILFPDS